MQNTTLKPEVSSQIDTLELNPDRPLVITDADEVIAQFMLALERHFEENGHWIDLTSFQIVGNVKPHGSQEPASEETVRSMMTSFFDEKTPHIPPVNGASEALARLSERAQIVILSNLPLNQRKVREDWAFRHGMPYPVIANEGGKGPAVKKLADLVNHPVIFLDDLPPNLNSVEKHAPQVHRIHFIADNRLAALMPVRIEGILFTSLWSEAVSHIETLLDGQKV